MPDTELVVGGDQDAVMAAPNRKRRRTRKDSEPVPGTRKDRQTKTSKQGKKGRLALILESPVEIVLEILSYLNPLDILNLSYVDKELRAMLTAKSSNSIWVAARRNIAGLPECPPDFSEAAYARFVFLKVCEMCGGIAHGLHEMPYIRVRLCGRCTKQHCINGERVRKLLAPNQKRIDLLPRQCPFFDHHLKYGKRQIYFKPTVVALISDIKFIRDTAETTLEIWRAERKELVASAMNHAERLALWLDKTRRKAMRDSGAARQRRLTSICSRLEDLGHSPKDILSDDFLRHRLVAQTAELTDRSWPNVRSQLEVVVEKNKEARLKQILRKRNTTSLTRLLQKMYKALSSVPQKGTFPPLPDLLGLPSIRPLIDGDTTMISAAFDACMPTLMREIEEFQRQMCCGLFLLWKKAERLPGSIVLATAAGPLDTAVDEAEGISMADMAAFLNRASTVFACNMRGCHTPLHYPSIRPITTATQDG